MASRFGTWLVMTLLLGACAGTRSIDVADEQGFLRMARGMTGEMQSRGLLDAGGAYRPALFASRREGSGRLLFRRLSPDFMQQPDTAHDIYLGETFAATMQPDSRVAHSPGGFVIDHAGQRVSVSLLAVADWDGDGRDEWVVACAVDPRRGSARTYYVLLPTPEDWGRGPVHGALLATYDCFGLSCTMRVRPHAVVQRGSDAPGMPPSEVQELLPGSQTVTTPPRRAAPRSGGLEERSL